MENVNIIHASFSDLEDEDSDMPDSAASTAVTTGQSPSSPASSPPPASTSSSAGSPFSSSSSSRPTFLHPDFNAVRKGRSGGAAGSSGCSGTASGTGRGSGSGGGGFRREEANFLQKLRCRETGGVVRSSASGNPRDPEVRFFSRLPGRLAFCLRDAIPFSAIESGHIFLGFSKCGQFLLSYTQTEADIDLTSIPHLQYHYRLHWWLFVPYRRAKKVAEITLFNNQGAAGNLHLSFCQWPHDTAKVLVFGYQVSDVEPLEDRSCPSRPCYITVTAIPALKACKDCSRVAANYEEDEMAAAWNSCVRLSCLDHGATVHTTFDLVPPYPKFEPRVSLKRDSGVVINSGNLLHFLNFELEEKPMTKPVSTASTGGLSKAAAAAGLTSELRISVGDSTAPPLPPGPHPPGFFSPIHSPSMPAAAGNWYGGNMSADSDCESDASSCYHSTKHSVKKRSKCYPMNPERLERVAEFVNQLSPPQFRQATTSSATAANGAAGASLSGATAGASGAASGAPPPRRQHFKRVLVYADSTAAPEQPVPSTSASAASSTSGAGLSGATGGAALSGATKALADKAYEINDDNFNEGINDKLSTFRKKRLADKKYEFKEDDDFDAENITPLTLRNSCSTATAVVGAAAQQSAAVPAVATAASPPGASSHVLQPLDENKMAETSCHLAENNCHSVENSAAAAFPAELLSPTPATASSLQKREQQQQRPQTANGGTNSGDQQQPLKFHAKFTRRYIELDDEMVSVISGIDVDDDGVDVGYQIGGGYHSALPLEVHGSGYQAMTVISNAKAEKLNKKCIKIQQNSLDVDWFCHDMAQKLCAAAGKTYWYCNDYDVEVVDLDPVSGDVICVAVVLVTATYVTQKVTREVQISALQRHLHQGTLKFYWNVDSGHCQLIDSEPLKELYKEPHGIWHPARNISLALQKTWGVLGPNSGAGNIRCFTNDSVIRGTSLKTIVDTDHLVAIILDDLE